MKVLVLGGAGFIGRYVVAALRERGHEAVVATRPHRGGRVATGGDDTVEWLALHRLCSAADWCERIAPYAAVVNCVGILRERWGESYDAVHHRAPAALALACRDAGVRLIHITALGLAPEAGSGFISSKLAGEAAIRAAGGEACIVRPSLLDGEDGFGSRWLRRVARWPIHPVPADARGRLAPLHVRDLGSAIAELCACERGALPATVELGGEARYSMAQYLAALRASLVAGARPALAVPVPAWLVRLSAHLLDLVHLTPLSWGHVELMRRDNAPRAEDAGALRRWIGHAPAAAGAAVNAARRGSRLAAARA